MRGLRDLVEGHTLRTNQLQVDEQAIRKRFPDYLQAGGWSDWHQTLQRFAMDAPFRYYNPRAIQELLSLLEKDITLTFETLAEAADPLDHAIFAAVRPTEAWDRETQLSATRSGDVMDIDRVYHPEYTRFLEHIYQHMLQVPLGILDAHNDTNMREGTHLASKINQLRDRGFGEVTRGYNKTVRNAISHGRVRFTSDKIEYHDTNDSLTWPPVRFGAHLDALVNDAHAILAATLLFISRNHQRVDSQAIQDLPLGFHFLRLSSNFRYKGFSIDWMVESETIDGRPQINVHCRSPTKARQVHQYDARCIGTLWSTYLSGRHERIAIAIDTGTPPTSGIFLSAAPLLRSYRENTPADEIESETVVDGNLLWHDAPKVRRWIFQARTILENQWEKTRNEYEERMRSEGYLSARPYYWLREVEELSAGSLRRYQAHAVLYPGAPRDQKVYEEIVRDVGQRLMLRPLRGQDITKKMGLPLPPDKIIVCIHDRDRRLRNLSYRNDDRFPRLHQAEWISPLYEVKDALGLTEAKEET